MDNYYIKSFFPWNLQVIAITVSYNALCAACLVSAVIGSLSLFAAFALCCLVLPLLFAPFRLIVYEKSIKISRLIGKFDINICDIKSIRTITDDELFFDRLTRTCGSGGLYGFFGIFRHDKYGKIKMFVTRNDQCFLMKLKTNNVVVISSTKRTEIVDFINKQIHHN